MSERLNFGKLLVSHLKLANTGTKEIHVPFLFFIFHFRDQVCLTFSPFKFPDDSIQ